MASPGNRHCVSCVGTLFVQRRYATACLQAGGAATIAVRMCLSQMRGQRRQTTDSLVSETLLLLLLRRPDVIVFC